MHAPCRPPPNCAQGDKEKDKEEQPQQQQPEVKRLEKLHPAQKSSAGGSRARGSAKKGGSSSSSKAKEGDKESVTKLFGSGPEQVQYEKDKEQGIWKVRRGMAWHGMAGGQHIQRVPVKCRGYLWEPGA